MRNINFAKKYWWIKIILLLLNCLFLRALLDFSLMFYVNLFLQIYLNIQFDSVPKFIDCAFFFAKRGGGIIIKIKTSFSSYESWINFICTYFTFVLNEFKKWILKLNSFIIFLFLMLQNFYRYILVKFLVVVGNNICLNWSSINIW